MWANAQRYGRPAEYRWRPQFNAAVWLTPTTRVPYSNAARVFFPTVNTCLSCKDRARQSCAMVRRR